jgi:hypothetical protein
LSKDRDALLAFYDFSAEHWKHLRTTNVIESSFATVRHRTVRSKGCLSNKTAIAMISKIAGARPRKKSRLCPSLLCWAFIHSLTLLSVLRRSLDPLNVISGQQSSAERDVAPGITHNGLEAPHSNVAV